MTVYEHGADAGLGLPTLSEAVPAGALALCVPTLLVLSAIEPLLGGATPDPPSLADQMAVAELPWMIGVDGQTIVTTGPFLSTLLPPSGPAVVVFPTASFKDFVPVCALAVSLPAGTFVESEKVASLAGSRPEPPSAAVHARETSVADQALAGPAHENVGALRSTLLPPMSAGEGAQLSTASQAWSPLADAAALSVSAPAATLVVRSTSWE